ncbi:MAG TPA: acetate uptake transporter [Gaiellaceae bacterium]|nr:acetate uptake transporter [Gaiellaceae bacterium]
MATLATDRVVTLVESVPAADPAPLGLAGFALTTFLLSGHGASFIPDAIWVGPALFYGGVVQLLAGMWEFRNRNVFGATAFSSYGGFWLGLGTVIVLADLSKNFAAALAGSNLTNALAWFFFAFAIFNTYMLLWSLRVSVAVTGVFLTLEITEIVLCIAYFNLSHGGSTWWLHAGGWCGVVTAAVAWYTSAAGVVNGMSPGVVLPVGAAPIGRIGSPMPRRAEAH